MMPQPACPRPTFPHERIPAPLLVMSLLVLAFWSCRPKKKDPPTLEEWVQVHFPGELRVARRVVDLNPAQLATGQSAWILEDPRDALVQLRISIENQLPDFGLDPGEIRKTLGQRMKEKELAQQCFTHFEASGLTRISVARVDDHLYILHYAEPDPASRRAFGEALIPILADPAIPPFSTLWVEWMEPGAYRMEAGPVVPFGYWHRGDAYHLSNTLLSLSVDWDPGLSADDLHRQWRWNDRADRLHVWADVAFRQMEDWLASQLPGHVMNPGETMTYAIAEEDPGRIKFSFPYFVPDKPENTTEPAGYVTGLFDPDAQTCSGIDTTHTP